VPTFLKKVAKSPLFLAKKLKNRPNNLQKSTQFFKKLKKAHFSKYKSGHKSPPIHKNIRTKYVLIVNYYFLDI